MCLLMESWGNTHRFLLTTQLRVAPYLVPHQANIRILQGVGKKLGLSDDQVIVALDKHANTSAASIPLALFEAKQAKKLTGTKKLVLTALGAGLTWGCCIITW